MNLKKTKSRESNQSDVDIYGSVFHSILYKIDTLIKMIKMKRKDAKEKKEVKRMLTKLGQQSKIKTKRVRHL
ncbi:hypothetical protein [Aneurinibacillus terranovensis]|uniref:hypothetical protein n=1 Tax=Aneurinibacillus terranovensis TaxID=278991 RepID=UPI000415B131|nr:hypothetical protein [Aneurinibacillus terranovensis]